MGSHWNQDNHDPRRQRGPLPGGPSRITCDCPGPYYSPPPYPPPGHSPASSYSPAGYAPAGYPSSGNSQPGRSPSGYSPAASGYYPSGHSPLAQSPPGYASAGYPPSEYSQPGHSLPGYSPPAHSPPGCSPIGYPPPGYPPSRSSGYSFSPGVGQHVHPPPGTSYGSYDNRWSQGSLQSGPQASYYNTGHYQEPVRGASMPPAPTSPPYSPSGLHTQTSTPAADNPAPIKNSGETQPQAPNASSVSRSKAALLSLSKLPFRALSINPGSMLARFVQGQTVHALIAADSWVMGVILGVAHLCYKVTGSTYWVKFVAAQGGSETEVREFSQEELRE